MMLQSERMLMLADDLWPGLAKKAAWKQWSPVEGTRFALLLHCDTADPPTPIRTWFRWIHHVAQANSDGEKLVC